MLQDQRVDLRERQKRLNPFEVREVLQGYLEEHLENVIGLNPFEVREVLQGSITVDLEPDEVSIPLKSGRCCKSKLNQPMHWNRLNPFEVREVLQEIQL